MFKITLNCISNMYVNNFIIYWVSITLAIATVITYVVICFYAERTVELDFAKLTKPVLGYEFYNYKLVKINNKKVKIVGSNYVEDNSTNKEQFEIVNGVYARKLQFKYIVTLYTYIYIYFFAVMSIIMCIFAAIFMVCYVVSILAYYYNINNSVLRPDFILMLHIMGLYTYNIFIVSFTIITLIFLYDLLILIVSANWALLSSIIAISSLKLFIYYMWFFSKKVITEFLSDTRVTMTNGWRINATSKLEYIVSFNNIPVLYFTLFIGLLFYMIAFINLMLYKECYSIGSYSIGRRLFIKFVVFNMALDIFIFMILLMPELPIVIFNGGYDIIDLLKTVDFVNNGTLFKCQSVVCKVRLQGEYILLFMLVFNVFINLLYALVITNFTFKESSVNYNNCGIKSWFTVNFWVSVFSLSITIQFAYITCLLFLLYYKGNLTLNTLMHLHFDSVDLEYLTVVQACVLEVLLFGAIILISSICIFFVKYTISKLNGKK